ncbi:hypothetical protein [Virgibacillus salexigens]|uniref:hypothetical protein n=1 Tax=Virgibacillus massiliensis TaxID=1462526 RepID=UPI0011DD3FE1|nr:hypothetical protein [Virgibacillus massiliensis]
MGSDPTNVKKTTFNPSGASEQVKQSFQPMLLLVHDTMWRRELKANYSICSTAVSANSSIINQYLDSKGKKQRPIDAAAFLQNHFCPISLLLMNG